MLTVTDRAATLIGDTLEANRRNESDVFRLNRAGTELGFVMSEERDDDQVVRREERPVLVIDATLAEELDGSTIDTVDTPETTQLVLRPPGGE